MSYFQITAKGEHFSLCSIICEPYLDRYFLDSKDIMMLMFGKVVE